MANEWRPSNWGDEVTLEYGKAIRGYSKTHGKYRVFGSNGPIGWTSDALTHGPGVVLGRKGAYRGVEFCREPFWVIDTAYYVVPKTDLDMRWLYYAVKHYKLGEVDDGSPIPSTTRAAVYMLELDVPPKHEQRAIAHILGTLDEKIDVNRRISESVDLMAREVFRDWFVAYGPVHSNHHGRAHSGLSTDIAELFPSEFSEEGTPVGWAKRKLADVATIVKGKSYKSSELLPSKTALVTLKSFNRGGGYRLDGLKEFTGQYKPQQEVFSGDLIIAYTDVTQAADVIGRPALVMPDDRYEHLVISLDVGVIRPANVEHRLWLYGLALTDTFQHHMRAHTTGTTVLHLSSAGIPNFTFHCPPDALIQAYNDFATPLFSQIEANIIENSNLAKMRDLLLPRLLSGELRIKDAEKFLEMKS